MLVACLDRAISAFSRLPRSSVVILRSVVCDEESRLGALGFVFAATEKRRAARRDSSGHSAALRMTTSGGWLGSIARAAKTVASDKWRVTRQKQKRLATLRVAPGDRHPQGKSRRTSRLFSTCAARATRARSSALPRTVATDEQAKTGSRLSKSRWAQRRSQTPTSRRWGAPDAAPLRKA
jgi:hypothetical protein